MAAMVDNLTSDRADRFEQASRIISITPHTNIVTFVLNTGKFGLQ